jgi:hypothetical protein
VRIQTNEPLERVEPDRGSGGCDRPVSDRHRGLAAGAA